MDKNLFKIQDIEVFEAMDDDHPDRMQYLLGVATIPTLQT